MALRSIHDIPDEIKNIIENARNKTNGKAE